ncbi:hypothetical protein ABPG72_017093 [Tetrahymena utriculariae]
MIDINEIQYQLKSSYVICQTDNSQKKTLSEYISKNKQFMEWTVQEIMSESESLCNQTILPTDFQKIYTKAEEKQNTDDILRYAIIYYKYLDNFRKSICDQIPQCVQALFIINLCKNLMTKTFIAIKLTKANDRLQRLIDQNQDQSLSMAHEVEDYLLLNERPEGEKKLNINLQKIKEKSKTQRSQISGQQESIPRLTLLYSASGFTSDASQNSNQNSIKVANTRLNNMSLINNNNNNKQGQKMDRNKKVKEITSRARRVKEKEFVLGKALLLIQEWSLQTIPTKNQEAATNSNLIKLTIPIKVL